MEKGSKQSNKIGKKITRAIGEVGDNADES